MPKLFPLFRIRQVFKRAGAERVSVGAVLELRDALVQLCEQMVVDALSVAKHARRVTIKREDIRLVKG